MTTPPHPPQTRFALRALASGAEWARVAELLGAAEVDVEKDLRAAVQRTGATPPPRSAGAPALLAAVEPLLATARAGPSRQAATRCPSDDVIRAVAATALEGPLLLATLEHVADCGSCLPALLSLPADTPSAAVHAHTEHRGGRIELVLGALAGVAIAVWYLLS